MKKTLNVNIGSVAFTVDDDAYYTLNNYFEDIRSRLYEGERQDVMDDVESRTADIFREDLTYSTQVVGLDLVKRTIAIIGNASSFGEKKYDRDYEPPRADDDNGLRKLYRSRSNMVVGGVCGGIAEYFNIDTSLVRLLAVLFIFIFGLTFWAYIVLWIVLPLAPQKSKSDEWRKNNRRDK